MNEWLQKAHQAHTLEKQAKYLDRFKRDQLARKIRKCRKCPLNRIRTHAVPLYGPYEGAELVIVGEAPGKWENDRGEPFIGRAGQVLKRTLTIMGGDPEKVIYMNVLACRPPRNRDPLFEEIDACREWFHKQLAISGTFVGVAVGAFALRNVNPEAPALGTTLNKPFWKKGRVWIPTYHPAYILRNPLKKEILAEGLRLAVDISRGTEPLPPMAPGDVVVDKDQCLQGIEEALIKQNWAYFYLEEVQSQIMVKTHSTVVIPEPLQDLPVYTLGEMVRLGVIGAGKRSTKRLLLGVSRMKDQLDGTVTG